MDIGLNLFDVIDHYLNTYVMLIIGIFECCAVGWLYNWSKFQEEIGKKPAFIATIGYWGSLVVGVCVSMHILYDIAFYVGFIIWIVGWWASWGASFYLSNKEHGVSFGKWID